MFTVIIIIIVVAVAVVGIMLIIITIISAIIIIIVIIIIIIIIIIIYYEVFSQSFPNKLIVNFQQGTIAFWCKKIQRHLLRYVLLYVEFCKV